MQAFVECGVVLVQPLHSRQLTMESLLNPSTFTVHRYIILASYSKNYLVRWFVFHVAYPIQLTRPCVRRHACTWSRVGAPSPFGRPFCSFFNTFLTFCDVTLAPWTVNILSLSWVAIIQ